jgi:aminoglycoside 2''-phosphotransferase
MRGRVPEDTLVSLLQRLRQGDPGLTLEPDAVQVTRGQFNDVLLVDGTWVFRLPRSQRAAAMLQEEAALLRALQGRLPLPTPDPALLGTDRPDHRVAFMRYRLIPGVPLTRAVLAKLPADCVRRLVGQIGGFLQALHQVPVAELSLTLPAQDGRGTWEHMGQRLRTEVFPFLRPDAREAIARQFEEFLQDPAHFAWHPVLRHGDFGGTNILYDPEHQVVSGVIDFGAAGPGDPAVDLAALMSYGDDIIQHVCAAYPALADPDVQARARFYRGTHALQQALWALETGDETEFADGIASYL